MFPDWTGQTAVVVASGQSAAEIVPHIPRDHVRVMVVNLGCELVPWADALYAADSGFWQRYAAARNFAGRKFGPDPWIKRVCPSVEMVEIYKDPRTGMRSNHMQRSPVGVIGGGGNSGFQALNLVLQFGPARVFLAGFDYGGKHWHPDHPRSLRNPAPAQLSYWAKLLDDQAAKLAGWGCEIVNLSRVSTLRGFRRGDCSLLDKEASAL